MWLPQKSSSVTVQDCQLVTVGSTEEGPRPKFEDKQFIWKAITEDSQRELERRPGNRELLMRRCDPASDHFRWPMLPLTGNSGKPHRTCASGSSGSSLGSACITWVLGKHHQITRWALAASTLPENWFPYLGSQCPHFCLLSRRSWTNCTESGRQNSYPYRCGR